jgi:hypothetical protein
MPGSVASTVPALTLFPGWEDTTSSRLGQRPPGGNLGNRFQKAVSKTL